LNALSFVDHDVIVLGERDGIAGPAIAKIVESGGGRVVLAETQCFV
jgi:adenine deaminase